MIVKEFLCFELETGGKIIGWFTVILSGLCILMSVIVMAISFMLPCEYRFRMNLDGKILEKFGLNFELNDCQSTSLEILLICSILILISIGCFFVYQQLLRGISSRSHDRILPALILEIISLGILIIDELLSFNIEGLLEAITTGCISFYFCVVLYSLYVKFRDEKKETVVKVMYSKPEGIPEDLLLI